MNMPCSTAGRHPVWVLLYIQDPLLTPTPPDLTHHHHLKVQPTTDLLHQCTDLDLLMLLAIMPSGGQTLLLPYYADLYITSVQVLEQRVG